MLFIFLLLLFVVSHRRDICFVYKQPGLFTLNVLAAVYFAIFTRKKLFSSPFFSLYSKVKLCLV